MATLSAVTGGYLTSSNGVYPDSFKSTNSSFVKTTDLYLKPSNSTGKFACFLFFNNSINSLLNLNEKTWASVSITNASITLLSDSPVPNSGYTIGIGIDNNNFQPQFISKVEEGLWKFETNYVSATKEGYQPTVSSSSNNLVPNKGTLTFEFKDLFSKISTSNSFKPSTTKWYIFIHHPTINNYVNKSNSSRFYSVSESKEKGTTIQLTILGEKKEISPFYLYEDDKWKILTPYIYDGKWIKLDAKMF